MVKEEGLEAGGEEMMKRKGLGSRGMGRTVEGGVENEGRGGREYVREGD